MYANEINSLDLSYETCPVVCAEESDKSNCEECPVKAAHESFREFSIVNLENNPKTKNIWRKFGFEKLKSAVEEISSMEEIPRSDRTVKTHQLIQCFISARNRFERIQRDNERETEK